MLNLLEILPKFPACEKEAIGGCHEWKYAMLLLLVVQDWDFRYAVVRKSLLADCRIPNIDRSADCQGRG
jgi:hypothetical protein